jgi:hypothetical protein
VPHGPAGESSLAQLGLLTWDETGEPPIPPPARGSPAESGRSVVSGRGSRCQGASPEVRVPIWCIGSGGAHRDGLAAVK